MTDEDEVGGRSLDECEALYRAAISCAGLLFRALAPTDPLVLSSLREGRTKPDIDQVLSTSSVS